MTEDEAQTRQCFRAATFGASQQLADGPGPNCTASACMGWRWAGPAFYSRRSSGATREAAAADPLAADGWEPVGAPYGATTHFEQRWRRAVADRHGYCGPAGEPTHD